MSDASETFSPLANSYQVPKTCKAHKSRFLYISQFICWPWCHQATRAEGGEAGSVCSERGTRPADARKEMCRVCPGHVEFAFKNVRSLDLAQVFCLVYSPIFCRHVET